MRICWVGLVCGWFALNGVPLAWGAEQQSLERIAFGSCYKPDKETRIWEEVEKFKPQLWIWLGDNFYNDFIEGKYIASNDDPKAFEKGYGKLGSSPAMRTLQFLMPDRVMATWDDHDYGKNDAGKDYDRKEESRRAFVKFWGNPDRSDGVYLSKDWGPRGKCVRVILLDTRYNRDFLPRKRKGTSEGDILGESQWRWLEGELLRPGADLVLIGSSIQFVSEKHPYEKWVNFPKAKDRFLQLIVKTRARGVIFLSGDRHMVEISCSKNNPVGYPLYDFTSSGLTEASSLRNEENPDRIGNRYGGHNFGGIRVDWGTSDPKVTLEIHGEDGRVVESVSFSLSQLAPRER